MQLAQGYPTYNPHTKEQGNPITLSNIGQVERKCMALIHELYTRNRDANLPEPFVVCAISRVNGMHRWFNLSTPLPQTYSYQGAPIVPKVDYAGAMNHAEALLSGKWRVATIEEYKACHEADVAATKEELSRRAEINTGAMLKAGMAFVQGIQQEKLYRGQVDNLLGILDV